VTPRHLKSRHGQPKDIALDFCRRLQRFTPHTDQPTRHDTGKLQSALAALWKRTPPAGDDADGEVP
jgi:hypothetical protein